MNPNEKTGTKSPDLVIKFEKSITADELLAILRKAGRMVKVGNLPQGESR